ncbi:MAG TPA: FmdB family zinc ribbon protein [Streptosporangiaceae bacterium]
MQKFSDDPLTVCPVCGGRLRKVFSAVGIVFKGSGFYRNDSRKVPAEAGANGAKKEGAAVASTDSSSGAASGSSSGDSSGKSGESSGKSGESSGKSGESSGKSGKSGESSGSSSGEKKPESARAKSASSSDTKVA